MPEVEAFLVQTMIMASFGCYVAISGHDHGTAWCESAA
jgi:hypothetical protein